MPSTPDFPTVPGQQGMATVAQLYAAGWSESAVRHARRRLWQEPMPRVIVPHRGPLDADARLTAAALWAGPKAVLTGGAALSRFGLVPVQRSASFILPETARARMSGTVHARRSTRPAAVARRLGVVRVTTPVRALADAATFEKRSDEDLEHLAIAVLQRGLGTAEALDQELWCRPAQRVNAVWRGMDAFLGGAWSRPEGVLRDIIDGDGGFPPLLTNCTLVSLGDNTTVGLPDGYIEDAGVAIQVQSRQHHQGIDDRGGDRWARTVEKDSEMAAVGVRVLGVTPWTLYSQPNRFLDRLRKLVDIGLTGPRPAVRAVPLPPTQ